MKTRVAVAIAAKKSHVDPPKQSKDKPRFLKNLTIPLIVPLFLLAMLIFFWWRAPLQQPIEALVSSNYRSGLVSLAGGIGLVSFYFLTMRKNKRKRGEKASESHASDTTVQNKAPCSQERELRERKQHEVEILSATDILTSVTENLLQTTNELASSAAQMAAALTQTTTTVEEVQQTAALSSEKAQQVLVDAQNAAQVSQAGKQATEDTISEMHRIHEQMRVISESIQRLSEQSQTVRDIIDTANDLAEQSNVLAVNAAIEAQKAGVHGGGFVIVAQEVRSLAQQSKDATTQVQEILTDIENATDGAVQNTAQGAKAAEAGMHQSVEAGEAIRLLSQSVQESAQSVAQIAASSQQQMLGIEQLVQAVRSMQEGNTQTATGVQQLETSIQRLQQLAQRLTTLKERLAGGNPSSVASASTSLAEAA